MTTLYHGTSIEFDSFDTAESNSGVDAVFFTPDYSIAAGYAEDIWGVSEDEGRVIDVEIDTTDAIEIDTTDEWGDRISLADLMDRAAAAGVAAVWLPDTCGDWAPRKELAVFDTSIITILGWEVV